MRLDRKKILLVMGTRPEAIKLAPVLRAIQDASARPEIVGTDAETAELVKLSETAFRDVNIAFANELSLICRRLALNVWDVITLADRHPRVDILRPGHGVGGHCIAVDPWFIAHSVPQEVALVRAARGENDGKPIAVIEDVMRCAEGIASPVIACLGLAFKPDIADLRESPALSIVEALAAAGAGRLLVVEPNVGALPGTLAQRPDVVLTDVSTALANADIVVFLVNHRSLGAIDSGQLEGKRVVNACGWRQ